MKLRAITVIFVTSILSGCYRDNEEDLYPSSGTCDTTGATYAITVAPVLQAHGCISCHSGTAPSGNISLQNFASVKAVAQNGKLFGSLDHSPGFSPMPKGGNKLSACTINKIKAWIDAGALNN